MGVEDWSAFRDFRIDGLRESPESFASTLSDVLLRTDQSWRDQLGRLRDPQGIALIACDADGAWVGTMRAAVTDGQAWVHGVYVVPAARGGGVAAALMSELLAWAVDHASVAMLHVVESNVRARRFYESFGFTPVGVDGREIEMRRVLS
ncbi:GNAT family N-acetyltransferase [Williamsia sterculiae]|uniref:GNAT family N-acetyltransferase n=1 Tax=Williamsia sterculiae TaxID=1344003 RepID=UPI001F467C71|nr:GNAT family N-acetyltransferase [Williamsia sterculiae]